MWPEEIEKVYVVCHKDKEKDRYDRLVTHLTDVGIPDDKIIYMAPMWGDELTNEIIFNVYDPFLPRPCPGLTFKGRGLSKGEISLGLNFYSCVKDAVLNRFKKIIVLESDIYLRNDFVKCLSDLLEDLRTKEWDYVSLGEGVGTRPPEAPQSYYSKTKAYVPPHQFVYRCTDSMMFQLSYLEKIEKTFIPFREIIDWEMNFQNMINGGKALWADPPLAEQGTCFCRITTSLPA
jgi:Glycosyltransferase family 25 (LPS biosynthesis protein)